MSCSSRARSVPLIRARTTRSPASTSHPVAGGPASAVRSSAASIVASRRGTSPIRPATGARGVEHDDDPAVLLGLPGAHDEVLAARGGPPVDGAHVVALDVVAQAVELGALAAGAHGRSAVELGAARRAGSAGACARGTRQRPDGRAPGPTAAARPARAAEDAHGDPVGEAVAAPGRHQVGGEAHPLVRGSARVCTASAGPGRRAARRRAAGRARRGRGW